MVFLAGCASPPSSLGFSSAEPIGWCHGWQELQGIRYFSFLSPTMVHESWD